MPTKGSATALGFSAHLNGSLDEQLTKLRIHIVDRSLALAQQRILSNSAAEAVEVENAPMEVSLEDVAEAFKEAIGRRSTPEPNSSFFDLFPPFTCLSFLLCLVFGALGLASKTKELAPGFLDVAKIFAGALVGSTASNIITATKAKKRIQ